VHGEIWELRSIQSKSLEGVLEKLKKLKVQSSLYMGTNAL